jgi:hypothetical protein
MLRKLQMIFTFTFMTKKRTNKNLTFKKVENKEEHLCLIADLTIEKLDFGALVLHLG